ncbi:MAG: hypothetical protein G01um101433_884 [Parcubacteria group bacterium Gr01-1014_33]|nr:MAG: hypothetical protein G01um101433_884 [Parcubacteria group bacterium Gr01-1014_33]
MDYITIHFLSMDPRRLIAIKMIAIPRFQREVSEGFHIEVSLQYGIPC